MKKRYFCYRHHMGNMWFVMSRILPPHVVGIIREFWLIYSVDCFCTLPDFQLFRASWKGVQVTIQQTAGIMFSVKIVY